MPNSYKTPKPTTATNEEVPGQSKRPLYRFAELGRKVGLGPNRAIIGDD